LGPQPLRQLRIHHLYRPLTQIGGGYGCAIDGYLLLDSHYSAIKAGRIPRDSTCLGHQGYQQHQRNPQIE